MSSLTKKLLLCVLGVLLIWATSAWFIANRADQHFLTMIEKIRESKASRFLEIEVLSQSEGFFESATEIGLMPSLTFFDEHSELTRLNVLRKSGPIFLSRDGIQFGLSRWEVSFEKNESETDEDTDTDLSQPFGVVLIDFAEKMHLDASLPTMDFPSGSFSDLRATGALNFLSDTFILEIDVGSLSYTNKQLIINVEDFSAKASNVPINEAANSSQTITQIAMLARKSDVSLRGFQKKIKFDLQTNGSIWANSDTLSGDLQLQFNALRSEARVLDWQVQFRKLLKAGFWEVLAKQSEISSLFQQAKWSMEDIETPEQQDFLRSLLLEASKLSRVQSRDFLKPLLIAKQSEVATTATLKSGVDTQSSQFFVSGVATAGTTSPSLKLEGFIKLDTRLLNAGGLYLLNEWHQNRWFRQYETTFETDVLISEQQFFLDKIDVPFGKVTTELVQVLLDQ